MPHTIVGSVQRLVRDSRGDGYDRVIAEQRAADARVLREAAGRRGPQTRSLDYQIAVNAMLLHLGFVAHGETGSFLTVAELEELARAFDDGTPAEVFARRLMDRQAGA